MSSTTGEFEAVKRRVHERIGAWIARHWRELLSALLAFLGGAGTVFGVLHGQVSDTMRAANDLKVQVAKLEVNIAQLVTQRELNAVKSRVQELEDWKCYAQQYRGRRTPDDCQPRSQE